MIFQDEELVYRTTKEQFEKRMLAVKNRLREKNFTISERKSNSKPVDSVSFLRYSISKEGIAQDPKHIQKYAKAPTTNKQLEYLVGRCIFYGKMSPDFATKCYP